MHRRGHDTGAAARSPAVSRSVCCVCVRRFEWNRKNVSKGERRPASTRLLPRSHPVPTRRRRTGLAPGLPAAACAPPAFTVHTSSRRSLACLAPKPQRSPTVPDNERDRARAPSENALTCSGVRTELLPGAQVHLGAGWSPSDTNRGLAGQHTQNGGLAICELHRTFMPSPLKPSAREFSCSGPARAALSQRSETPDATASLVLEQNCRSNHARTLPMASSGISAEQLSCGSPPTCGPAFSVSGWGDR